MTAMMNHDMLNEASDGLFLAAEHGRSDVIKALIEHGKGALDLTQVMDAASGKTPLHVAIMNRRTDAVRVLLAAGFPPDAKLTTKQHNHTTAYAMAKNMQADDLMQVFHQFLIQMIAIDDVEKVQKLIQGGISIQTTDGPPYDNTLFHWAVSCGAVHVLQYLLDQEGVQRDRLFDQANADGATPLHEACRGNHVECVRLLLLHDANRSIRGTRGFSADKTPIECTTSSAIHVLFRQRLEANDAKEAEEGEEEINKQVEERHASVTRAPSTASSTDPEAVQILKYELLLEEKDVLIAQLKKTIEVLATESHEIQKNGEDKCVLEFIRKLRNENALVRRQLEDAEDFIRVQQEQIQDLKDQVRQCNKTIQTLHHQMTTQPKTVTDIHRHVALEQLEPQPSEPRHITTTSSLHTRQSSNGSSWWSTCEEATSRHVLHEDGEVIITV